ncbi:hypothetical protein FHS23_001749 [Prauserella isguenensis]|uniref:Dolichyl-phosphate-mannose-protein mannosyltransferase n=1 Tax=Prauserella isguenensis TaxID=1470180 RepID=A0A839RZ31_9PSEU|nr:hypothetical protein [Prauserella isguenensis]MBB3050726.1 hypothetical protein [Prauserella isguenensis]
MPAPAQLKRRALDVGRNHWLFLVVFVAGFGLRAAAWFAYPPALLYGDSFRYLDNVGTHNPTGLHPIGYDLFVLEPVLAVGGLGLVSFLQHVAGLACGVALYALARRLGVRRNWLAALAAAPVLLDAYEVQIEQMIMSDVWFQVILVALLWLLLGTKRGGQPPVWATAVAGVLFGVAVIFRMVALPLALPAVVFLLIAGGVWRRWGTWAAWRTILVRVAALALPLALMVVGYGAYYASWSGHFALSPSTGNVLYARGAVVADCQNLELSERLEPACPDEPLGERLGSDQYAHMGANAEWRAQWPEGTNLVAIQQDFGKEVIRQQPFDVAVAIMTDFLKGFRGWRVDTPGDVSVQRWHFQPTYQFYNHEELSREYALRYSGEEPESRPTLGTALRWYQLFGGFTPGNVLGVALLLALAAGLGITRKARASGLRAAMLLPAGMALVSLGGAAAFEFSWRYQLPGITLLPLAGVLALTALLWRRNQRDAQPAGTPAPTPYDDAPGHGGPGDGLPTGNGGVAGGNGVPANGVSGNGVSGGNGSGPHAPAEVGGSADRIREDVTTNGGSPDSGGESVASGGDRPDPPGPDRSSPVG